MTSPSKPILPHEDDISDETAAVLTEILIRLAGACDARYAAKIMRYEDRCRMRDEDLVRRRPAPERH